MTVGALLVGLRRSASSHDPAGPGDLHRSAPLEASSYDPAARTFRIRDSGFGIRVLYSLVVSVIASCTTTGSTTQETESRNTMDLGAFSISLAVKDLEASRTFYEKLGFDAVGFFPLGRREPDYLRVIEMDCLFMRAAEAQG